MWMPYVPLYRIHEARIILQAKYGARMFTLGKNTMMPVYPVDPYEM